MVPPSVPRPWRRLLRFSVRGMIVLVLVVGGSLGWLVRSALGFSARPSGRLNKRTARSATAGSGRTACALRQKAPRYLAGWWKLSGPTILVMSSRSLSLTGRRVRFLRKAEQLLAELKNQSHAAIEQPIESRDTLIGCTLEKARVGPEPWELNEREAVLPLLKGLSRLARLNLNGVDLTGDRLLWLEGLTSLTHLNLGRTCITDSRLRRLRTLVKLSELNLDETEITDAGLAQLKGLTRLSRLDLLGTRVTDAGVQELQQALPSLKISR